MKRLVILTLATGIAVIVTALATASGPQISGGLEGSGMLTVGSTNVELSNKRGFVMEWAKVPPGASFGWHLHRAAVAVAVTAGTLTLYDGKDPACKAQRYSAGHGFVEPAGRIHTARNEGKTTVALYATYVGVPGRLRKNPVPLDVAVKSPGNCPADVR